MKLIYHIIYHIIIFIVSVFSRLISSLYYIFNIDQFDKKLSPRRIKRYLSNGKIIDGRRGGLLLAEPHSNGGIDFIEKCVDGTYLLKGNVEGYEYLINKKSSRKNWERLSLISDFENDKYEDFIEYKMKYDITLIETNRNNKYLLLDQNQFIVNKYSTKKHLLNLEKLNRGLPI